MVIKFPLFSRSLLIAFLGVFFCGLTAQAQQPQLLWLNRIDTKDRTVVTESKGVEFWAYPLTSDIIDLRDFKKHYPEVQEMDYIKVQLPDMSAHTDSMVLVGFLQEKTGDPGVLVILLAGDYGSNKPVIFVDRNLDQSYLNDDKPVRVTPGKQVRIELDDLGKKHKKREFFIYIPKSEPTPSEKQLARKAARLKKREENEAKIRDQFSLGLQVLMGNSKLTYSYLNLNYGYPTWYEVFGSEKGLGVNLTYNFPHFRIGVQVNHQHLSYWSSYKYVQHDAPTETWDPSAREWVRHENIVVDRNRDVLPQNRFQWSLVAAYRWHIFKNMEIQPRIAGGWFTYLPGKYTPEKTLLDETFNIPSTAFYDAGVDFDFSVAPNQAFTVGLSYMDSDFRPTGFFESTPHENLETNMRGFRASIGYRIGLK